MNQRPNKPNNRRVLFAACVVVLVIAGLLAFQYFRSEQTPSGSNLPFPPATPSVTSTPSESLESNDGSAETGTGYSVSEIEVILANLGVANVVDNTGYRREFFGDGWLDTDGNGCDTRNDILLRDLINVTLASDECRVLSGLLIDSYTGVTIDFVRGQNTSQAVQIDHLFPLSRAWALGASYWTEDERKSFANDPANLYAVDGSANNNKSDQGISDWTPAIYSCITQQKDSGMSNKDAKRYCLSIDVYAGGHYVAFDCEYAARYVLVSNKYDLAITEEDKARIVAALAIC